MFLAINIILIYSSYLVIMKIIFVKTSEGYRKINDEAKDYDVGFL